MARSSASAACRVPQAGATRPSPAASAGPIPAGTGAGPSTWREKGDRETGDTGVTGVDCGKATFFHLD